MPSVTYESTKNLAISLMRVNGRRLRHLALPVLTVKTQGATRLLESRVVVAEEARSG
jgi:hypothetical protein